MQRADGGGSTVDAGFRAWLGPAELLDVAWSSPRRLGARVPAGLAAGWYDLAVEGPSGTGLLPHAYLAVDGAPPSLAVSLVAPPEVTIGEQLQLTVRAENTGTWIVEGVVPAVSASGAGAADPVAASVAAQDLLPGALQDFVLLYAASRAGALTLAVSITGTDPRTGDPVLATTSTSVIVRPPPSVGVIADDPLQDGSPFAFVAGYGGGVIVGPNDGHRARRHGSGRHGDPGAGALHRARHDGEPEQQLGVGRAAPGHLPVHRLHRLHPKQRGEPLRP